MLIRAYIIILSFLSFSTCINGKTSRRKGMLLKPTELETWTGKWFPFDPTYSTTTTKEITTTTTGKPPKMPVEESNSSEHWSGKWFPFDPTYSTTTSTSEKPIKTLLDERNSSEDWQRKLFPFKKTKSESVCDDGQHSFGIDFDPTDKRHSYNYLCLTKNHTSFKPNLNVEAIQIEQIIPPAYVPPVKCLNESISYENDIPTFGAFRPLLPKFGTYKYLPPQRWLRGAAEGAIIMLYHPCAYPGQVKLLQNTLKSCLYRHIITPSQNLSAERPLALIAWGRNLQMSVVDERIVVDFIKSNAKRGPLPVRTGVVSEGTYESGLLTEAKLITDIEDTEICGYKEM